MLFLLKTIAGRIRSEKIGEAHVVGWDEKNPQIFGPGWKAAWRGDHFVLNGHDLENVKLLRTTVGRTGKTPPADAKVIFNGKDMKALTDKKGGDAAWKITPEGALEIPPASAITAPVNPSATCVCIWNTGRPSIPEGINRKRGNGGVYLQSNYEIQLTDNFGNDVNEALSGAIYHIATPKTNASAPPMEWGSLEVEFSVPRYDAGGKKPRRRG